MWNVIIGVVAFVSQVHLHGCLYGLSMAELKEKANNLSVVNKLVWIEVNLEYDNRI